MLAIAASSRSASCGPPVAHVDQMATGAGRVIPSSQVQVVQSLEPGIVAEILVEEGNRWRPART